MESATSTTTKGEVDVHDVVFEGCGGRVDTLRGFWPCVHIRTTTDTPPCVPALLSHGTTSYLCMGRSEGLPNRFRLHANPQVLLRLLTAPFASMDGLFASQVERNKTHVHQTGALGN